MAETTTPKAVLPAALSCALAACWASSGAAAADLTVGRLTLTPCVAAYGGSCGTLPVPVDRRDPGRGTIGVRFEFYPARGGGPRWALGTPRHTVSGRLTHLPLIPAQAGTQRKEAAQGRQNSSACRPTRRGQDRVGLRPDMQRWIPPARG